jgi:hypothetical protein
VSKQRFIALLIAALVAISGALYLSTQRNLPRDPHGSALLPSLAGELDTVTSLSVRKGAATPAVTVQKQGEHWTVAERAHYPADVAKVHKLLLALSDAKIREEKTADPANYATIGVEDPSQAGATGAQIELTAKDGKHGLIVGKYTGQGNFVRRAGEKTSYSVEPAISFEAEPRYWIDTRLLDIPGDKIQSVEFKPATGPAYSVHRVPAAPAAPPAANTFALEGAPSGRLAADPQTVAPSPTMLSSLAIEDVAVAGDIDFTKPSIVTVVLSDGGVLTFTGTAIGDKKWIQVTAPKDASLSAKTGGHAFEIASYRYDLIFRPLEQLLVPKLPPPGAKPLPGTTPAPSAKRPVTAPKP